MPFGYGDRMNEQHTLDKSEVVDCADRTVALVITFARMVLEINPGMRQRRKTGGRLRSSACGAPSSTP